MRPAFAPDDLELEFVFDRFLDEATIDQLQALLQQRAPRWCRRLRVQRSAKDQEDIDLSQPDGLSAVVLRSAVTTGATYAQLVEEHGRPPRERFAGSAELRGAGPELVVVVSVDQMVVSPLGNTQQLRNSISVQIRRPTVEGHPGFAWAAQTFAEACETFKPVWASARHPADYWSQVMSEGPPIRAIGRDFGRWLPGLYWQNYFGTRYLELLPEPPGFDGTSVTASPLGDGLLVSIDGAPGDWQTPEWAHAVEVIREALGPRLFFDKDDLDTDGEAPIWAL